MDLDEYITTPQKGFWERFRGYFIEFFETAVVVLAVFALIHLFVAQIHKVSGNSMIPTLRNGDYLITEKISYRFGNPRKGDIIVLKNPRDESQDFIKRIIATPGDTIKVEKNSVFINNQAVNEPYLPSNTLTRQGAFLREDSEIRVGANQYFVFGDNRSHSSDSREWGPVTREEIVGRAFFRYLPIQSLGPIINK